MVILYIRQKIQSKFGVFKEATYAVVHQKRLFKNISASSTVIIYMSPNLFRSDGVNDILSLFPSKTDTRLH